MQLAHVSRPVVAEHRARGVEIQGDVLRERRLADEVIEDAFDEQSQVFAPVSERRKNVDVAGESSPQIRSKVSF